MSAGKYRKEKNCLNCDHHVAHHYCSNCGQPNLELKESFWTFIGHSVAHYFHFDSKFFQTLVPLLTKPGLVTLDYIAGKRARYINPVSMYIFVSIVYFIVVPYAKHSDEETTPKIQKESRQKTAVSVDSVMNELDKDTEELAGLAGVLKYSRDKVSLALTKKEFRKLDFNEQRIYLDSLKSKQTKLDSDSLDKLVAIFSELHIEKQDSTYEAYMNRQSKLADNEKDDWFDRQVKKQDIEITNKSSNGNWSIKSEVEKYRPKQYFMLMPLLAFFIMLNFRKNHIYYLDHLIFTIHGMTAYFIVSIIYTPLVKFIFGANSIMANIIELGVIVWIFWYLYSSLKVFYKRSRKVTIWKMVGLLVLYGIALWLTESIIRNTIYYIMV